MRYRILACILAASFAAVCSTGCDVKKAITSMDQNSSVPESDTLESTFPSSAPDETDHPSDSVPPVESVTVSAEDVLASTDSYTVRLVRHEGEVHYAQIADLADENVQSALNEMLRTMETDRYEQMKQYDSSYSAMPVVHYADESVLSLTQTALFGLDPATAGKSLTPLNFDMTTGEELELRDLADTQLLAEKIWQNDGITIVEGYDGAKLEDFTSLGHISSAADVQEYIETYTFSFDADKHIVLHLGTPKGQLKVIAEE